VETDQHADDLYHAIADDDGHGHPFLAHVDAGPQFSVNGSLGGATAANLRAWREIPLLQRAFRDVSAVDASVTLFGQSWAAPLSTAPWAGQIFIHPEGERATARGARAASVGYGLSSSTSVPMTEVAAASGPFLQQVYVPRDRTQAAPFIERARENGAWGFAVTVDAPRVAIGAPFRSHGSSTSADWPDGIPTGGADDLSLDDISWLTEFGLPVLCKGIQHPDDAVAAVGAGAAGIIVSNHGGRQLAGATPTAHLLPAIVAAVNVPVLVDGGIRSAEDLIRAVALGASAVLVGRPVAWALAAGGADAVESYLRTFVREVHTTMAKLGLPDVASIDDGCLFRS
jgi:4-hydroxymandelate oxidase